MQKLTTLGKVSDIVDVLSRNCVDKMIPAREITFDNLNTVRIANEPFALRDMAQLSFAYRLGIPLQYLKRCPPEIQKYNLDHWITKEKNEELLFRFDGNDVRVVFTPRYTPVDNFEILERLDSLGYGPDTEVQCSVDHEFMMLNIPEGKAFTVNGDKMRPGLSLSNSEVGIAALSISAFILRLVCTNGMISSTHVAEKYKHISRRILDEFPEVLGRVSNELASQKNRFLLSLNSKVAHPENTIKSLNRQFALGKVEQEAVEWAWPQEAGDTMFHIVNTYTRAAQFENLPSESAYTLQKTGGNILAMVKEE